jgi:hypothetical protein
VVILAQAIDDMTPSLPLLVVELARVYLDQIDRLSENRPQAFPPSRNDDRRHRTHASDPEGSVQTLGRLGTKGNTAPKIWNAVLAA